MMEELLPLLLRKWTAELEVIAKGSLDFFFRFLKLLSQILWCCPSEYLGKINQ